MTWAAWVVLAAPAPGQPDPQLADLLDMRARVLDRIRVAFEWEGYPALRNSDPFDPLNWMHDDPAILRADFELWVVRPWWKVHEQSWFGHDGHTEESWRTWINDRRTTLIPAVQGEPAYVTITASRREARGPFPLLTPIELEVFDLPESLAALVASGDIRIRGSSPGRLVVAGEFVRGSAHWTVRAVLDRDRDGVPIELEASVRGRDAAKPVRWELRATRTEPRAGIFVIGEAILVLDNPVASPDRYYVYRYALRELVRQPDLATDDLAIRQPQRNVHLFNEVEGIEQRIGPDGRVLQRREFDPQEFAEILDYAAQMEAEARRVPARRRAVFVATTLTACVIAGVWTAVALWKRRAAAAA